MQSSGMEADPARYSVATCLLEGEQQADTALTHTAVNTRSY